MSGQVQASLTIGIDARAASEVKAGRGRVVRELLQALASRDEPNAYVCYARTGWDHELDDRFRWSIIDSPDPLWHARTAKAANRTCDVFLSTNSYLTVPLLRVPTMVVVYDLVAFEPSLHPNRRSAVVERLTLGPAVRRARTLWCISQATADALLRRFPAIHEKIRVIPLAVAPTLLALEPSSDAKLPPPGFVLAVGTLEPRKNLPRLVAAYASLPTELQDRHPLVVVGAGGWSTGPTLQALRSLGRRCTLLGHVSEADLAELYRGCAAFCYPSLGEGFGLPVLEAMAAGAAVVTSNVSSLPEVGGDAVEYVDPSSVTSIAAGLRHVLQSEERRRELQARGPVRAASFSWAQTAGRVVGELRAAALGSEPGAASARPARVG